MADASSFKDRQYAFAAHIRDPENVPAPENIEPRRMAVYRDLFFNNLHSLLGKFFPVLRRIHSDAEWRRFVRGFLQRHEARTPYFLRLPEEFLAYLQNEFEPAGSDYPFLVELAHYEYAELALSISEATDDPDQVDPHGDLVTGIPVKSSLAMAFTYRYPVHRIAPEFLPREPADQPVCLALYRDDKDDIGFFELNAVTAALLEAIDSNTDLSGESLLRRLAVDIAYPDADALVEHGAAALEEMRGLHILAGTRRTDERSVG